MTVVLVSQKPEFPGQIVWYLLVAVILILIKSKLVRKTFKRSYKTFIGFSQLPSLPVIGPLHHIFLNRHDIAHLLVTWRKNLGRCWQTKVFGKHVLLIHEPDMLKPLLESGDIGHLEKFSFIYDILFVGAANNGLLSMPATHWIPHRKVMNTLFTYETLKNYVEIFKKHADQLVQNLSVCGGHLNRSPEDSNYGAQVHVKMLDIITEIAIGIPLESVIGRLGCLEFHQHMENISKIISTKVFAKPWQLLPFLWHWHPNRKKLDESIQAIETVVQVIRENHVSDSNSRFALDLMINARWSDAEITSELLTFIVAGYETVSSSLNLHLWMLALEQEHQLACRQEVDQVFDALQDSGQDLTLSCLSEMKYLERCIKESLRLFPSTPFGTGRELKTQLKLDTSTTLEPGTVVMFSTYILHRDPQVFPNPEKFDPDRFLPENVKHRNPYAYLPFSGGVRNCLGWKMALLELSVLTAVILRHFHLETTDKRDDIKILFSHTLHTEREPNILFTKRR